MAQLSTGLNGLGVVAAALALGFVYLPLFVRLRRIARVGRQLQELEHAEDRSNESRRASMGALFEDSPMASQWGEFTRRWRASRVSNRNDDDERAPVRFADILAERPLLPAGARRNLLPALPSVFLSLGILGTLSALTLALPDALSASGAEREATLSLALSNSLGVALFGLILAIAAALLGRFVEGRFDAQRENLDFHAERAYGSITPAEVATRSVVAQREGIDRLSDELVQVTCELNESIDRGLGRIEKSSSQAATLISKEQRKQLHAIVGEIQATIVSGVETHLSTLRVALERSAAHQQELASQLEAVSQHGEQHRELAGLLSEAGGVVDRAARALGESARDLSELPGSLGTLSSNTAQTSVQLRSLGQHIERLDDQMNGMSRALIEMADRAASVEKGIDDLRSEITDGGTELRSAAAELVVELRRSVEWTSRLALQPAAALPAPVPSGPEPLASDPPAASDPTASEGSLSGLLSRHRFAEANSSPTGEEDS